MTSPDWHSDDEGVSYPPEPWRLHGELVASLWFVPVGDLPLAALSGLRPVTFFGRAIVGTVWARYDPSGILAYDEVMAALRVRTNEGAALHVPLIWVDHPSSAAGGRALWSIPKRLATFASTRTASSFESEARSGDRILAAVRFRPLLQVPGRWPVRTLVAQSSEAGVRITPARASARLSVGQALWRLPRDGPLAFLAGRKPVVSLGLSDATLTFGVERRRTGAGTRQGRVEPSQGGTALFDGD